MADTGPLRGAEMRRDRRSIRLARYDYGRPGAYFVTVVAAGRGSLFGDVEGGVMRLSPMGEIVRTCWTAIPDHSPGATLDAYILMPNHIHGILILGGVGARHAVPNVGPATNPRHRAAASGPDAVEDPDAGGDPDVVWDPDIVGNDVPGEGARHAVPLHDGGGDFGRDCTTGDGAPGGTERYGRPAVGTIPTVVRSFKAASTRQINALRGTPGIPVWQRNYYEHVIRTDESLHRIRQYIADNPLKWALDRLNGPARGSC